MLSKLYLEVCECNCEFIVIVFDLWMGDCYWVLEIGSGIGQYVVFFVECWLWLCWQFSDYLDYLFGIEVWCVEVVLLNLLLLVVLQVELLLVFGFSLLQGSMFDVVFSVNILYIMGWQYVQVLFGVLLLLLCYGVLLVVYGLFNYGGCYISDSNVQFDVWLKVCDLCSGICDSEVVQVLVVDYGFICLGDVVMLVNNCLLLWWLG